MTGSDSILIAMKLSLRLLHIKSSRFLYSTNASNCVPPSSVIKSGSIDHLHNALMELLRSSVQSVELD